MLGKAVLGFTLLFAAATGTGDVFANSRLNAPIAPNPLILVQAGTPRTEAILRKTIEDLQQGKPDFSTMEPELQSAIKEQAQHTADIYRHLGTLQSLKYIGTQNGSDLYRAVYRLHSTSGPRGRRLAALGTRSNPST
jgi:hypothetical protein